MKKEMKNSLWRGFLIPLICFLIIPPALAQITKSFLVYPYLRNTLKMEFSYYKDSVYYLTANDREMTDNTRGNLNRFCIGGTFPFVSGFSDNDKKTSPEEVIKEFIDYVFVVFLFSFYFLELCFFILLQWKFNSIYENNKINWENLPPIHPNCSSIILEEMEKKERKK